VYAEHGQSANAIADFDHVIGLEPGNLRALIARGRLYSQIGEHDNALRDIEAVLAAEPGTSEVVQVLKIRATILFARGDSEGALAEIVRARGLDPQNTDLMLQHASMLEKLDRRGEALAVYGEAIPLLPVPGEAYIRVGKIRYAREEYSRAVVNFTAALESLPDSAEAYRGIGMGQRRLGNTAAAVEAFSTYLSLAPEAGDRAEIEAWIAKQR
jgi:tetratricopeptide (TPR) repeat protein